MINKILKEIYKKFIIWLNEGFPPDYYTTTREIVMVKKKIHVASCDDWVGLYIDGKRVTQGHSLHWPEVLDILGIKYTQSNHYEEETMEKMRYEFPANQDDLIYD